MGPALGIDLGGTKIAAGLFAPDGTLLTKRVSLLDGAEGEAVGALLTDLIRAFISSGEKLSGIGVCVPGIAYGGTGRVWAPNIPGWEDYPLRDRIRECPGVGDIPVFIESDRTCYILGEYWKGAAKGCRNAIYLAVGTGIGAGILADGRILHGAGDIAGATGWMALQEPFLEEYVRCGCFEYYASGTGIGERAAERYGREDITSPDVFAAYEREDPVATAVLDKAVRLWGMAAANFVSLFNPEILVFGGGVFGPAARFMDRIYAEACRWGQPVAMKQVRFLPSAVQGDAALIGAAALTLHHEML